MTEPLDDRIRESLADLMAAAPEPRPFSDDLTAGKRAGTRRRFPAWVVAPVAAVITALVIGLPVLLLGGGADGERAAETTASTSTVPVTQTTGDGTTTTLPGQPMVGEGPEDPMPMGQGHVVGDWDITVQDRADDGAPVLFANPDGTFLVGVRVAAAWLGEVDAARLPLLADDVRFFALGADGQEVAAEAERCPDHLPWDEPALFPEGNICFSVRAGAADGTQLIVEAVGDAVPHRAYFATDVSAQVSCYDGACPVRYLEGPELTREEFLATDIGQILESTFIGGDAEAENGAYVQSDGFSIVSDTLVLGYRNGRAVSSFRLEGGRVAGWGSGDGSARLVSGDLTATVWNPVTPIDSNATVVPITVAGGACATGSGNEVTTEIRFVEVVEDDSTVQVVVWTAEPTFEGYCAGVGIFLDAEIQLAAPLGDRALLDAGVFPVMAAGVTEEPLFPFHLYVSNQSTEIDPVTIEVWVDGDLVVDQAFEALGLHNWILFDLEVAEGWHEVRATALDGEVELQESFYSSGERWGILDFGYSGEDGAAGLTWRVQDVPFLIL